MKKRTVTTQMLLCLLQLWLGFSCTAYASDKANECNVRENIRVRFRHFCCGFLSTVYTSFGLYLRTPFEAIPC